MTPQPASQVETHCVHWEKSWNLKISYTVYLLVEQCRLTHSDEKIYTIIIMLKIWKRWQWSLSKYWDQHQASTYWTGFHLKEGYRDSWGTNRNLTLRRCSTHKDACKKFWLFMLYNLVGYCLLCAVNNNLQHCCSLKGNYLYKRVNDNTKNLLVTKTRP